MRNQLTHGPCGRIERLLWDYATGHLRPAETDSVDFHLAGCESCAARAGQYRACAELIGSARAELVPESGSGWEDLAHRICEESRPGPFALPAWAAAAAIAALTIVLMARSPSPRRAAPGEQAGLVLSRPSLSVPAGPSIRPRSRVAAPTRSFVTSDPPTRLIRRRPTTAVVYRRPTRPAVELASTNHVQRVTGSGVANPDAARPPAGVPANLVSPDALETPAQAEASYVLAESGPERPVLEATGW